MLQEFLPSVTRQALGVWGGEGKGTLNIEIS